VRSELLGDFQGQRLGYKTTYFEHTIGRVDDLYDWLVFRPEIRFDYTTGAKVIDNIISTEINDINILLSIRYNKAWREPAVAMPLYGLLYDS
jgi:hypothetical protein